MEKTGKKKIVNLMSDWENAMENYNEIQEYSLRMAKIKTYNASAGKRVEQQTCSLFASGSLNRSNLFEKLALSVTMEHLNIL